MRAELIKDITSGQNLNLLSRDLSDWPEIAALKETIQDKEWHAEGDVLIHTEMVLKETPRIIVDMKLNDKEASVLRLASLFHDICKPGNTEYSEEIGHVIAPGHERLGGIKTRYILHEFPEIKNEDRILISNLVATHHLLKRAVKRYDEVDGVSYLLSLAARVDTRMLYALELADMRGRFCVDQEQQIEIVELFRMICEENDVFGKKPALWPAHLSTSSLGKLDRMNRHDAAFVEEYLQLEINRRRLTGEISNEYAAMAFINDRVDKIDSGFMPFPASVMMAVGVAGSGKSTLQKFYFPSYDVVSLDATRKELYGNENAQGEVGKVVQQTTEALRKHLRDGSHIYFDATNVIPDQRARWVILCHDYGAKVQMVVFDVSLEEIKERNSKRERVVPLAAIYHQASKFELPLPEEAHQTIYF